MRNWMRHFWWSFFAICYVGSMPVILYQLMGQGRDWPGIFLQTAVLPSGAWQADILWTNPGLAVVFALYIATASVYATWRRNDHLSYRESRVQSARGF
ncbi:hypothetical protein JCM16814_20560 [Desulfobaculum senezii]